MIRIAGGEILTAHGLVRGDVWVEGDTVVRVGEGGPEGLVIDARGMLVGPGLVDVHTHLREPGETWKEDIATGTLAAARGGYTAVVAMPNTTPPIDTPEVAEAVMERGRQAGNALVAASGALTVGRSGRVPSDATSLYEAGVRLFTDDGDTVADPDLLIGVMRALADLPGAVVAQHAESPGPQAGSVVPSASEWRVVERDLGLARETGARYHVQHVSARETVALVSAAKAAGVRATAEVTPHHLTFDETSVSGPDFKMYPPLRSSSDRAALRQGLVDGTIDMVATDHAPHTAEEKSVDFEAAPRGVIGLETSASAVWEVLADPAAFFEVLSIRPARLAGLIRHGAPIGVGSPANLTVFDPALRWRVDGFASKSANSPYLGRMMTGRPVMTIFEGAVTHQLEGVA